MGSFLYFLSCFSSVQFSCSVVSNSLRPHGLQHARSPYPSPTPRVHPTISSSVIPFSSCSQSFPGSGFFPISWLFASGGQRIGASATVLPMTTQDWSPSGWTGWISLRSKGLSRVFFSTTVGKHQFFLTAPPLISNFESALWNSEKVMEARAHSLQTRNAEQRKAFVPRSPTVSCSVSIPGTL